MDAAVLGGNSLASEVLGLSLGCGSLMLRALSVQRVKPKVIKVHSFKGFDPPAFVADLQSQPWDTVYLFDSPEDAWFGMEMFLKDVCNRHAPLRTLRVRGTQPSRMSDKIRLSMKQRDSMKRKAVKSKLDQDWISYKRLRNTVTRQIELAKRGYYNDLLTEHANDASKLWSAIRKLIPKKNKVAVQELTLDNKIYTDNSGIANCFNKFFTSLGARLKSTLPVLNVCKRKACLTNNTGEVPDFAFKDISVDFVRKELSSLRVSKSSGLKDIHSRRCQRSSSPTYSHL